MNIVEVCHLDVASFGRWDDPAAELMLAVDPDRPAYRKLLWHGDRLTGAMILGPSDDIWTTNDVGMLKGLVQSGVPLGPLEGAASPEPLRRQARLRRLPRDPAAPPPDRARPAGPRPRRPLELDGSDLDFQH